MELLADALGAMESGDYADVARERAHHRARDGGLGLAPLKQRHKAALVAALIQAAPTLINRTDQIDGMMVVARSIEL